ncbi:dethiobiotin synthetase [Fontimonas thermophila]|uniref:ATP-dependent dethiobiotin synthetase BioD n=1 Tax=Fontimonas thermophila TaxID=1076937 RepID=A0A1I2JZM0_9GAMM|nr:dethiobiotin synthase [Fontimonas thermophila]SFF59603.1 dethiobiotin synthetase [Fontimonas thermophila]
MSTTLFVTGTDTGVGKTRIACALLRRARQRGLRACGYKPVASGCARTAQGLRNEDALALLAESAPGLDYAQVNPIALEEPIAPHIAAARSGVRIDPLFLSRQHAQLAQRYERVVVEGAGGWRVPLDADSGFDDWVAANRFPVVLVVGLRLGCINHALLSAESILRRTTLAGWVANVLPPEQPYWRENVDTLRARLPAPLWGVVPMHADADTAAAALAGAPW